MRVTRLTLLAAALAVSVCAKDAAPVKEDAGECLAPSAVTALESKVDQLQQSNAALQLQVDSQAADKTRLLADVAQKHEAIVLKLQGEIAALTKDVEVLEKDVGSQKEAVDKAQAELKAALDKLADEIKRASTLDKNLQALEKKNRAMSMELSETTSVELTMASLLSAYYDDALVVAEQALVFAQQKLDEQSGALDHVQVTIEDAKKTACDTTSKFYQDNLAATLDPILVDVHKSVHPHLEKYLPIVQQKVAKAKEQAVVYSQEALRRAKLARVEAITLLEQNEHVANHAQKVVDGVLVVLAVPLVLFQIRLALRLVWWLFTTTLCVLTCGLCCRSRKRCYKNKRKGMKKTPSVNASLNAPLNGPSKKTTSSSSKTTSTTQKRSKKGKN
ncbi:hypothetical protein PHYSODRAFT_558225 [Phytophthora sojae]|uniref:Uncharacterized protein n=1 Tax=Phytophthora sojae (strain P6497) TaxID=1094619 RepID=G4ZB96_PHYSP|nr:hypothetical protein PHYSODRAFT_558225 [Phytophthora sojae]EGZ22692.1 hypothetical protein PHYSODRAFT_558225 [Phytophthora sojae]|eukprot:XP_009525409.1 hypothetical protein PHYSODRAFT_558225 [Phytophthora sojae]